MLLILKKYRKKAAYTLLILLFGNVFLFGNLGGGATQTTWAAV
jgi:hypothetical protein